MEIGSKVRVENSNNTYWGMIGVVVSEQCGQPYIYGVDLSMETHPDPGDGPDVHYFAESELEDYPPYWMKGESA